LPLVIPRTFRGTRDFLPSELLARRRILEVIEEAYRRYGFQPLETPAIEYMDILTGKSEENDKLIYEIKRARGGEEDSAESAIALRYDLTVPLARVVAQYADLPRPFKRYQIQPVWRADRPQPRQGRFREFVQCDADIVGTDSLLADAEIIALTYEILRDLGFEKFVIRLSSRKFLSGFALLVSGDPEKISPFCRSLDKLDKIGIDKVKIELADAGIENPNIVDMLEQLTSIMHDIEDYSAEDLIRGLPHAYQTDANHLLAEGFKEIRDVRKLAIDLGVQSEAMRCDPTLARGLDYYTGPIWETVLPEHPHIGSLTGGGRYDGLVETFSKEHVPATGTTIGLDRIQTALTQLGKFASAASTTQVLIARFDADGMSECLKIAAELRHAGVRAEVWYDDDRMKKQFAYADKQGIPLVIIAGPDERLRNSVAVKNLRRTEQKEVPHADLVETVKAWLRDL
jgi:histidyl-tRNA synthetase